MNLKKSNKNEQPLVSFLLPVYNVENFITETLQSLLAQTYTNFEVIAINDGSKDKSLAIVNKFAKIDKRIRVFSHKKNVGISKTLNEAIDLAKGELLARIDGDDVCLPKRLEWQVAAMQANKKAALCYGFYEIFDESGEFLGKTIRPAHQDDLKRMLYVGNAIAHPSVMLRKKLLPAQKYRDDVGPTEDYELWSRLAEKHDFVCVPRVIIRYRINTNSIMHRHGHLQWDHMARNLDSYWQRMGPPAARSPKEVRAIMRSYMIENDQTGKGLDIMHSMLHGEADLAFKCIRRGYKLLGIKIFLGTALSSRTGLRLCRRKFFYMAKAKLKAIFALPGRSFSKARAAHARPSSES